jgi:hypothetical protein
MLMILLAALSLQAPDVQSEERRLYCLADPLTGEITSTVSRAAPGGSREVLHDGVWAPVPTDGPEAANLDWYKSGEDILRDGHTYVRGEAWTADAFNRYLRDAGLHRGAAIMTIWPAGDIDLAVLVRQEGCEVRTYVRQDRRRT